MKGLSLVIFFHTVAMLSIALPSNPFSALTLPDSLKAKLNRAEDEKQKIDIFNDVCYYFSDKTPQQIIPIAQKIVFWADSVDYKKGLFDATLNLGILFFNTSQYTQALACYKECLELAEDMDDTGRKAATISNMGLVFTSLSQYQKAIDYQHKALKIRERRKDTLAIALSLNNLGMTYHTKGDWNVALHYYRQAIHLLEGTPYKNTLANTYNNLGQLFFTCYNDTATWAADSAEYYYMKAYTRFSVDDNRLGVIRTLINLGNTYSITGSRERAVDAYRAALNLQRQSGDSSGIALTLFNMGILFDEMGDSKRGKEYLLESLRIAKNYNLAELSRDIYQQLFHMNEKNQNLSEAVLYASKFFAINDSLNEMSKKLLIEQFKGKYNFQEVENALLSSQLIRWKQIGWATTGLIIVILSGFIIYKLRSRKSA
ncbi:MAG: tetratricopeptide repeat protein [Bacteroidales bacterium]|nr:tetratricopeptide repeat protein [Bacteroidales bacterium]